MGGKHYTLYVRSYTKVYNNMQKMLYTNIFSYVYFEDRNVSQELLGPHTHKKKL